MTAPRRGRSRRVVDRGVVAVVLALMATPASAPSARGESLVEIAREFRALLDAGRYDDARAMMSASPRRWFNEREGEGRSWTVGARSGPWAGWDEHFRSRKEEVEWLPGERSATVVMRETNDYFELLERGWVTNEIIYLFDDSDRIDGLLIRAVGDRPPGRTEEFLQWARAHDSEELDDLMPGGEIDPSAEHPPRFRVLLNRWRQATAPDVRLEFREIAPNVEVAPLADGVWIHRSWRTSGGSRIPANGLIVHASEKAILVDTGWEDAQAEAILNWISSELRASVAACVVTHAHPDRAGGLGAVHARGVPSHGAAATAQVCRRIDAIAPQNTFLESTSLDALGERLKVVFAGAGHSPDNTVVYLPELGILFGGCLIKGADAKGLGFIGDADLRAWPATLRRVMEFFPGAAVIVPGHGAPGGRALFDHTLALLQIDSAAAPPAIR